MTIIIGLTGEGCFLKFVRFKVYKCTGGINDDVESFQQIAANDTHFLPANGAFKESCGNVG